MKEWFSSSAKELHDLRREKRWPAATRQWRKEKRPSLLGVRRLGGRGESGRRRRMSLSVWNQRFQWFVSTVHSARQNCTSGASFPLREVLYGGGGGDGER